MIIIAIVLLVTGGALWLSARSINRRSEDLEDDMRFSGVTASEMSQDESRCDSEEDERLVWADIKALNTYAKVLKAVAVICMSAVVLIIIVTYL